MKILDASFFQTKFSVEEEERAVASHLRQGERENVNSWTWSEM